MSNYSVICLKNRP